MTILQRVLLAFGLIIGIGALGGVSTIVGTRSLSESLTEASERPIGQVDSAWRATEAFRAADALLARSLEGTRDQKRDDVILRFRSLSDPIDAELRRALGGSDLGPATKALVGTIDAWKAAALVLLGDGRAQSISTPHVMEMRGETVRVGLQALVVAAQDRAAQERTIVRQQARRIQTICLMSTVFAILGGIAIAVPFALELTRPLRAIDQRMRGLVEGDLTSPMIDGGRRDEVGRVALALHFMRDRLLDRRRMEEDTAAMNRGQAELVALLGAALGRVAAGDLTVRLDLGAATCYARIQDDFNTAIESVSQAMETVAATTDWLFGGSEEITRATSELASRSEQQSIRLGEAAAALSHVGEAIRGTASSTRVASEAVSQANVEADRSGVMIRDAMTAIQRIETSAGQIKRITTTIAEIASHTNILALNTAIEAARAGESGRGFAVVAAEVRNLARRAAGAVEEIEAFNRQTSSDVRDGTEHIGRANEGIGLIMKRVASLDTFVDDVASAAERQADGLMGVVGSVSEADRATRHNVGVIDQSAASLKRFHEQAATLARLVGHFKVEGVRAGAASVG